MSPSSSSRFKAMMSHASARMNHHGISGRLLLVMILVLILPISVRESVRLVRDMGNCQNSSSRQKQLNQPPPQSRRQHPKPSDTTICVFTQPEFGGHHACLDPSVQGGLFLTADAFPEIAKSGNMIQSIQMPSSFLLDAYSDSAMSLSSKTRYRTSERQMQQHMKVLTVVPGGGSPVEPLPTPHAPMLDYEASQQKLREALDEVEPHITTKAELEAKWWGGKQLPFASNYSISDMDALNTTPERLSQRVIYFISPTYFNEKNPTQMVDFTRLKQTLQLASLVNHALIYWIVTEDNEHCTQRIRNLIQDSGLPFAHVPVKTVTFVNHHKGVPQRNRALEIVEQVGAEGVVFFGDDDNAYDTQLFSEIVHTRRVGIFSTGFAGQGGYERCQVDESTGQVVKLHANWVGGRKFPMDMAGFAFSTAALLEKHVRFDPKVKHGHLETQILESVADKLSDMEPLAAHCTRILSWHTSTNRATHSKVKSDSGSFSLIKKLL